MGGGEIIAIPLAILAAIVVIGLAVFILVVLGKVIFRLIAHVFGVIGSMIADIFRLIGATVVSIVFIPLIVLNIVIGRWSASAHYGRAFTGECKTIGGCIYRVAIGHPLRLIGLRGMTEGLEHRLPQAMAEAPGRDKPSKRQGLFEGFTIIGSLPGGGSGGKLYIAEPDALKHAAFERQGHANVERVVIKTFSLSDGSSLPQIVRESRALDAAKKMGLVLEHELTEERFYYVMRYVPGDSLTIATQRLHADADSQGLDTRGMKLAVGYAADLLEALDVYHRGGLWHKDVKPDNLIVDRTVDPALGRGKAHLVDFGLITPLRSAMTLTTHGTEYFRDPELVRQALRGVKVHQVDGAKFDVYGAGAVLFSMIENSFPSHGGLSQVSKRCPESLRWIIRRAMTDYDKRYPTARAMLEDLTVVMAAADPFGVRPADLPSMHEGEMPEPIPVPEPMPDPAVVTPAAALPALPREPARAEPVSPDPTPPAHPTERGPLPKLRVSHWWSGKYEVDKAPPPRPAQAGPVRHSPVPPRGGRPLTPPGSRQSAAEQLANARKRVQDRRTRARHHRGRPGNAAYGPTRVAGRRKRSYEPSGVNAGVVIASLFVFIVFGGLIVGLALPSYHRARSHADVLVQQELAQMEETVRANAQAQLPPVPMPPEVRFDQSVTSLVPAPERALDGLGLVFMSDFRPPFDEAFEAELERADAELLSTGVRTTSNLVAADDQDSGADEDTLAKLLQIRSQRSLDESLGIELAGFVREIDAVDAVWWLGPGDDKHARRYLLVDKDSVMSFDSSDLGIDDIATIFVGKVSEPAEPVAVED